MLDKYNLPSNLLCVAIITLILTSKLHLSLMNDFEDHVNVGLLNFGVLCLDARIAKIKWVRISHIIWNWPGKIQVK